MNPRKQLYRQPVEEVTRPRAGTQFRLTCGHIRPSIGTHANRPPGTVRCWECELRRDITPAPRVPTASPEPVMAWFERRYQPLDLRQVLAFHADAKYVEACCADGSTRLLRVKHTLIDLAARHVDFWQMRRNWLVNADYVERVERSMWSAGRSRTMTLIVQGQPVPVARRYYEQALALIVARDLPVVDVEELLYSNCT